LRAFEVEQLLSIARSNNRWRLRWPDRLAESGTPRSRGRHGRWQIACLSHPGNPVCRGAEEKGGHLDAHNQSSGTANREGLADVVSRAWCVAKPGEVQFHDAQRPGELSLHPPAAKGDAAERQLFTSSEAEEVQRIYEWSKETKDGSLSDFDIEPDPKVWAQVCSERGLCSPKTCGYQSDFSKDHGICFFQRARNRILSSDVLVLNHTLFFTLLGGVDEEQEGGILFKNDFVIFDEAHTMEHVASRHIGLSVSSGQVRYALNRLWNPRTEKGVAGHVAPRQRGEACRGFLARADKIS
jgi:hypothetical protein